MWCIIDSLSIHISQLDDGVLGEKKGKGNQSNELSLVKCVLGLRLNDNDDTHPIVNKWVHQHAAKQKETRRN